MTLVTTVGDEPARLDIDVYPGAPIDFTEPVYDAAGAAQDFTGWTLAAQIRASRDASVLHTLTLAAVAPDSDSDGGIRVTVSGADTDTWADWPVSVARWDLWATAPASEPAPPLLTGWVRIHSTITH